MTKDELLKAIEGALVCVGGQRLRVPHDKMFSDWEELHGYPIRCSGNDHEDICPAKHCQAVFDAVWPIVETAERQALEECRKEYFGEHADIQEGEIAILEARIAELEKANADLLADNKRLNDRCANLPENQIPGRCKDCIHWGRLSDSQWWRKDGADDADCPWCVTFDHAITKDFYCADFEAKG